MSKKNILVTGGAGFVGSHVSVALSVAGFNPVIFDDFSNSDRRVVDRLAKICKRPLDWIEGDVRCSEDLKASFMRFGFLAVVHCAGLKSVATSISDPLSYYDVNLCGTTELVKAMDSVGVNRLIFSSSATVYGEPDRSPIQEGAPYSPVNPYGRSKMMAEMVLKDFALARPDWSVACLRYFNPVGAHNSGLIGEQPTGRPSNLLPFVAQTAIGRYDQVVIHGDDFATPDGTGVRDYIHVMDLAEGHVATLKHLEKNTGFAVFNLGTGRGVSVLEVLAAFEQASGRKIAVKTGPRRTGDVPAYWADCSLAELSLTWKSTRSLLQMCEDSWRWQSANPQGYSD